MTGTKATEGTNSFFAFFAFSAFFAFVAPPAYCAYEDIGLGARSQGMANAFTGIGNDISSFALNPGGLGGIRKTELGTHFLRTFRTPVGKTDLVDVAFAGAYPIEVSGRSGTFGVLGRIGTLKDFSRDKQLQFSYGTWQFSRTEWGVLDFGGSFKILQRQALEGDDSAAGAAIDLGAVLRRGTRYTFGVALLNINSPGMDLSGTEDKAPFVLRIGASDSSEDYTLSLDWVQRSGSSGRGGSGNLNSGFEYWWKTYRKGVFGARTGLSLGGHSHKWSFGFSYKYLGAQAYYSVMFPLTGGFDPGHAVSILVKFGHRDTESEYVRLIKQEMRYRTDLMEALGEAEHRERLLREDLSDLSSELEDLHEQLKVQTLKAEDARQVRDRLKEIISRRRKAEKNLREMKKKREKNKMHILSTRFDHDWKSYLKLKSGGAPKAVLQGTLQRILRQYQGLGLDISRASLELKNIIRK